MKLSIDVGELPDTRIPPKGKMCVTQSKSKITIDMDCKCGRVANVSMTVPIGVLKYELEKRKK